MPKTETKTQNNDVRRQVFTGTVVSTKMKDTTVVMVEHYEKHRKYGKYMRTKHKILAHDPGNTKKEGEKATVEACRPISKRKAFKVIA